MGSFIQCINIFDLYENSNVIFNNQPILMQVLLIILVLFSIYVNVKSQCNSGYQCTACTDSNCAQCDNNINICQTCSTGYYLDATTGICTACPTKCLSCSTNTYCDQCTPGYDREYDSSGNQICVFYWWKWFLIVFGTLLGLVLIGMT